MQSKVSMKKELMINSFTLHQTVKLMVIKYSGRTSIYSFTYEFYFILLLNIRFGTALKRRNILLCINIYTKIAINKCKNLNSFLRRKLIYI